ncbi:MAG: hypothetical protein LBP95_10305 [Deltaproteobacteria bacterium]|jgi:Tfp pilus tip-associated adhesin PilY1|nr:hypothetical protein [Deltaproteobacteria bacterium]
MSKFAAILVSLLFTVFAFQVFPTAVQAQHVDYVADIEQYKSEPFLKFIASIPQVMIVLERDWKIFYPAYNNLEDLNGDGSIDNGFNPSIAYFGYFDVDSCYTNDGSKFVRAQATVPQTQEQIEAMRPGVLKNNIPSPASSHGVCPGTSANGQGAAALWAGNWLNYIATSRMDAIRKVLYGGKRRVDTTTTTVLEPSYVPSTGIVWGAEIVSDNLWNDYAPDSPWFPAELYIGFARPIGNFMHFFARVDHAGFGIHDPRAASPLMKVKINVDSTFPHPVAKTPIRYWDWVYASGTIPDDSKLPVAPYAVPSTFTLPVLVEVCKPGNNSPTEGCWQYGSSFKPVGLMQQYGERSNMQFGLITSTLTTGGKNEIGCTNPDLDANFAEWRCNDKGGVLRHHIDSLPGKALNSTTGAFMAGGIIDTMNKFEITEYVDSIYPPPTGISISGNFQENRFISGINTGNPVGEMTMEALRYLAGATSGLPAYAPAGAENLGLTRANWNSRPTNLKADCIKPFILVISSTYPSYDGDQFPTAAQLSRPRLSHLNTSAVPANWSVPSYLNMITDLEGYRTSGAQYYFPKTSQLNSVRGVCTAKNFDAAVSLSNISGFCPSEPGLGGSYSLAAAAYYGRTHDFSTNDSDAPAEFFMVGLSPSIPHAVITDGKGHQANIVPTAVVSQGVVWSDFPQYLLPFKALPSGRTMVHFIMKRAQSDVNGVNFRMNLLAHFGSTLEPNESWGREFQNEADIALLTTSATPPQYRESKPFYINTGPFRSTANVMTYCPAIPANQIPQVTCENYPQGNAYYAFKNPDDPNDHLDVTDWNIVGLVVVTNAVGSESGWSAGLGYTINGVEYSGVYLDTANMGHDAGVTPGSNAYPYAKNGVTRAGIPNGFSHPNISYDALMTPWECPYAGFNGANAVNLCGEGTALAPAAGNINNYPAGIVGRFTGTYAFRSVPNLMRYIQVRSFKFDEQPVAQQPRNLPNPLWLAAKYGGFKDNNKNGVPDDGEWDSVRVGYPDNYFEVANLGELPGKLSAAFDRISKATEAVTATSDSITSVLGGGLAIQTSYVPDYTSNLDTSLPDENKVRVKWVGNIFSLFIDQWGNLREDTNKNEKLDVISGDSSDLKGDLVVKFENRSDSDNSRITLWSDERGTNELEQAASRPSVDSLYELNSVWDTNKLLSQIPNDNLNNPRPFDSIALGRRIYSYTGKTPSATSGFTSGVPLSNFLFTKDNADDLAPFIAQGFTVAAPVIFTGTEVCDETARLKCGAESVVCKELNVSAVGTPPHGMTGIRLQITNEVAAGQVSVGPQLPGGILNLRVGRTTAKGVVTALNDFIYDNHVEHLVRAHLNTGDTGAWVPNLDTKILPTTYSPTEKISTTSDIIKYVSGQDIKGWRSRTVCTPWDTTTKKTWRMGDIINSKPVIVGEPVASYDLLYGDYSYSRFKKNLPSHTASPGTRSRRMMAYFGSNDGLLHAINLGFYGSLDDGTIGYSKTSFITGVTYPAHPLGSELWAYIPTSVLPHLTWSVDPGYSHSYYVDLEPMIVDIKNTSGSDQSLGGGKVWKIGEWKTVLIGGLRLGGRSIELDNADAPEKYLYSEYFALDVTNPDEEPTLLWRFTHPNLGLTVTKPALVSSADGWHVIAASGPTTDVERVVEINNVSTLVKCPVGNGGEQAYNGVSNQKASLFVINAYTGALQRELGGEADLGVPTGQSIPPNSFFNDSFVVSAVGPGSQNLLTVGLNPGDVDWHNAIAYFGLTESRDAARLDKGALFRLKMVDNAGNPANVSEWQLTTMYKTDRPVTGAVNATFDSIGNLWVTFGTGRLWGEEDRSPFCSLLPSAQAAACEANHVNYLYGLKEPMVNGVLTFDELRETSQKRIADVTKARVFGDGSVTGYNGEINPINYSEVLNRMYSDDYLGYKRGLNINSYISSGVTANTYEMILTQPKINALPNGRSNLAVTTYQPSVELCDPEGFSFLYLVDTFTGIPSPESSRYNFDEAITGPITLAGSDGKTYNQITGYLAAGKGQSTEAWILRSSNGVKYGTTGANQTPYEVNVEKPDADAVVTGTVWWREVMDMGMSLEPEDLTKGLPGAP